jgi:hypothetical protein
MKEEATHCIRYVLPIKAEKKKHEIEKEKKNASKA